MRTNRYAPTLVVVDMQPVYQASKSILPEVEREIVLAMENGWPIVVLQYKGLGRTYKSLLDLIHQSGARYAYRVKPVPDGSAQVAEACMTRGFSTRQFRICGVNALACVKQTALGLNRRFPESEIAVLTHASNGPAPVDWSQFPTNQHLVLRGPDKRTGAPDDTGEPRKSELDRHRPDGDRCHSRLHENSHRRRHRRFRRSHG